MADLSEADYLSLKEIAHLANDVQDVRNVLYLILKLILKIFFI